MSDIEFEKLLSNLKDLKKELELKLRYKGETTQFEMTLRERIKRQLSLLGIL